MIPRAVIFDADGVITKPPRLFGQVYPEQHGLDPASFPPFYRGDFELALRDQADLKQLIVKHHHIWHWDGDPQLLLDQWFAAENHTDSELLELIHRLRVAGTPVFLATSQERNRAAFFRHTMFPDIFDEMFISSELGCTKNDPGHWPLVLDRINRHVDGITPREIIFFDDSASHLESARRAGIDARLYTSNEQVAADLAGLL